MDHTSDVLANTMDQSAETPEVQVNSNLSGFDGKKIASEVTTKWQEWAQLRKPFEGSWFLNGAFLRGQQRVQYNDALGQLVSPSVPSGRIQLTINRIRPKIKARLAKFFQNRPRPLVVPSSTERNDILNARATEKMLVHQWFREHLEEKYRDARLWATIASKGFLWIRWDSTVEAKIRTTDPLTKKSTDQIVASGDINIEVGSALEIYPKDPTLPRIGQQPEFIRAKMRPLADIKARYPELTLGNTGDGIGANSGVRVMDRLGSLNAKSTDVTGSGSAQKHSDQVMVLEHFMAPCVTFPKGRYAVVIGMETAKVVPELPYDFYCHTDNPYPVVEFCDSMTPGQFWGTTMIEQMLDLQREYNFVRSLISENLRMMARPKIVVYKQHNLAEGAWTTAAGEIVELTWVPGLPAPQVVQPANIANDAWQLLALINREFDDITLIYPSSVGGAGAATSGFQTNLLQEATDSVHAPDIREDELAIQELAWKMRKLMKLGYEVPRMIALLGGNSAPEVFEFSKDQIDEFAEVRIQAGSMLPDLKSAKLQMAKELFTDGLFGNPQDPMVRRKVLGLIEMGGMDVINENERKDEDEAYQELQLLQQGVQIKPAQFFQDHIQHIFVHQQFLKSPEFQALSPQIQQAIYGHTITHYDWENPALALSLRIQYNLQDMPVSTPPPIPPMGQNPNQPTDPSQGSSAPQQPLGPPPKESPQPSGKSPKGTAPSSF